MCLDLKLKFQPKFQILSLHNVANQPCAISFSCESLIDLHLVTFIVFFSSLTIFAHCFSSSHSPSLHCFLLSFSLFELLWFNGFQTGDFCNASYVLIKLLQGFCCHRRTCVCSTDLQLFVDIFVSISTSTCLWHGTIWK